MRYHGYYSQLILGLKAESGVSSIERERVISAETTMALTGGTLSSVGDERNGSLRCTTDRWGRLVSEGDACAACWALLGWLTR